MKTVDCEFCGNELGPDYREQAAQLLLNEANQLEKDGDSFKIGALKKASRFILRLSPQVFYYAYEANQLHYFPTIGPGIAKRLQEIVSDLNQPF